VVVELDPVADHTTGVLQGFEAVPVDALLLQRANHPLHEAVLLRGVGRDELLLQAIAFDQRRVAATGEDQTVVRAQQERLLHAPQRAEAGDQGLLQGRPALLLLRRPRTPRLDLRPKPDLALPYLPAAQPDHPLHRVLVEPQQVGHRPVAKGRVVLDHRLDRFGKMGLN